MRKNRLIAKVVIDISVLVLFVILVLITRNVKPYHRGFFCDDEAIRYPYKRSTISSFALYTVGTALPILSITAGEFLRLLKDVEKQKSAVRVVMPSLTLHDPTFRSLVYRLYAIIGYFALGACGDVIITSVIKFSVGELRPHFLSVCKPNWSKVQCVDSTNNSAYTTNDVCTNSDEAAIRDARESFPSGHASFSFYSAVYLIIYLQSRVKRRWLFAYSIRPMLQFLCLTLAILTTASRISDYKHHMSDVIMGSVVGVAIASFVAIHMANVNSINNHCGAVSPYECYDIPDTRNIHEENCLLLP